MTNAHSTPSPSPRWARRWLFAAGVYNLVWGAAVILFPHALFDWAGMERMRYPEIWQCVGMIVGVYGIGYLIASRNPRVHWPIVLLGLLGKILGPIGVAVALADGRFPLRFAVTNVTNDLVWWIPFAMILWDAARSRNELPVGVQPTLDQALDTLHDQRGNSFRGVTDAQATLCVLVRHSGCTFCRETLDDLSRQQDVIRARGYRLAVFTMSGADENASLSREYALEHASWFSDPDRIAYRAFDLRRGSFLQLFGAKVIARGLIAALRGHSVGRLAGDGFQMPGAFVIKSGRVVREFRHRSAADRPDYQALACEVAG